MLHYIALYDLYQELEFADREEYVKASYIPELYDIYLQDLKTYMKPLLKYDGFISALDDGYQRKDQIMRMIDLKFDPSEINKDGKSVLSALTHHYTDDDIDLFSKFINTYKGACNINVKDKHGSNALIEACEVDSLKQVANLLLDTFGYACEPQTVNKDGCNALILAGCCGQYKTCIKMIDMFNEDCFCDYEGIPILHEVITETGYDEDKDDGYELIDKLIDTFHLRCKPGWVNDDGETALVQACKEKKSRVALKLVTAYGWACDPLHTDNDGKDAHHYATMNKMMRVVESIQKLITI